MTDEFMVTLIRYTILVWLAGDVQMRRGLEHLITVYRYTRDREEVMERIEGLKVTGKP